MVIDSPHVLLLEIVVNVILITGVVLYIKNYSHKWWSLLFVSALAGEVYLLFSDSGHEAVVILIWALILLPAFVMNLNVADLAGKVPFSKKRT